LVRCSAVHRRPFCRQLVCRPVGHGLVEHTGQRGIVLHVAGHDESHDLGGRQHREGLTGSVGDDYSGQPVLGEQARGGQRIGVDDTTGKSSASSAARIFEDNTSSIGDELWVTLIRPQRAVAA